MIARELRVGTLEVTAHFEGGMLHRLDLPPLPPPDLDSDSLAELLAQLAAHPLALELHPRFHQVVWEQMRLIPRGETRTYAALAQACGSPKAYRAVGQACGANPVPLLIPCHRVVSSTGLGGFSAGIAWKKALLVLEGARCADESELLTF